MKNWKHLLIAPDTSVRDALRRIDQGGVQLVMVVDQEQKLLGTVSDGDVRRGLLNGAMLDSRVREIMHSQPTVAREGDSQRSTFKKIRHLGLHQVPVVDAQNHVVGLATIEDLIAPEPRVNPIVIMAGGLGSRLKELTQSTPKPMLKVGGRPILELLIESFIDQGFNKFHIAVNYKAEVIEKYFGDGSSIDAEIQYLRETKRMGTAGALSLLPEAPVAPFFVVNADLVAKVDYVDMLTKHETAGVHATMAVREYEFQIPFGVVEERDGVISAIKEKPVHRSVVCAGIYVMSPEILSFVPPNKYCDMPTLFDEIIGGGYRAASYTVQGYWLDVGRMADFEKANEDFPGVFS